MKYVPLVIALTLFNNLVRSQPGKDGTYTVTGSKILNRYAPLSGNVASGTNTLMIPSSLNFPLCNGDLIMLYQAQGAIISTTNAIGYGDITSYNSAGLYEFKYVESVSGNIITTQTSFMNSYATSGYAQVIRVPQYSTLTINSGASVVPKDWKDTVISGIGYRFGGLVILHTDVLINNGTISANGCGFRGGSPQVSSSYINNESGFVSSVTISGGIKGEGIAGNEVDYALNGGKFCRGAAANGGGGGNSTNSPGGGGANGNSGSAWTGQGVMVVNNANPLQAWSLDPAYIANGNSLANSSGGGRGGYSWSDYNMNALTMGPGNSSWGGDSRRQVGGLGGRPLTNIDAETRIYFGGGGGSGQQNNGATTAAGDGGGIIYVFSSDISGSGIVSSDGSPGGNLIGCNCDGASGGGAGGSIIIKSTNVSNTQIIRARGGQGGSEGQPGSPGFASEAQGPGGGGGGGFVAIAANGISAAIGGGANGSTNAPSLSEFPYNGATMGASGQTSSVTMNFISYIPSPGLVTAGCANKPFVLSSTLTLSTYAWAGPQSFYATTSTATIQSLNNQSTGVYTLTGLDAQSCAYTRTMSIGLINNPTLTVANATICQGASVNLNVSGASSFTLNFPGGFSSVMTATNNAASFPVSPTITTIYTVQAAIGPCETDTTVLVQIRTCTGIIEFEAQQDIIIYPNPASRQITITSTNYSRVYIRNELGQEIKMIVLSDKQPAEVSGLSPGIYFVTDESKRINKKLVILK